MKESYRENLASHSGLDGPWVHASRVNGLYDQNGRPLPHPPETQRIIDRANALAVDLAVLLSFIFVGLPQMVMGQAIKGVVMLIIALVLGALTGCLACLITYPVAAIDAYMIASKLKRGQSVGEWEFF